MRRVILLVLSGLLLGAALTAAAGALPGSQDVTALGWLGTVSTVAALVVAVGIYRVQQGQSDVAHQELLDALKAQDEVLQALADADADALDETGTGAGPAPAADTPPPAAAPAPADDLTPEQRAAIRERYGDEGIADTFSPGGGRRGNAPRMVRLEDGTLLTVFDRGRGDRVQVREIRAPRPPRPHRTRRGGASGR